MTTLGTVHERLDSCLQHMFVPVFHGAVSTFLGMFGLFLYSILGPEYGSLHQETLDRLSGSYGIPPLEPRDYCILPLSTRPSSRYRHVGLLRVRFRYQIFLRGNVSSSHVGYLQRSLSPPSNAHSLRSPVRGIPLPSPYSSNPRLLASTSRRLQPSARSSFPSRAEEDRLR